LFAAAFLCQPALVPSNRPRSFGGTNEGPLSRSLYTAKPPTAARRAGPVSSSALLADSGTQRAQSRSYSRTNRQRCQSRILHLVLRQPLLCPVAKVWSCAGFRVRAYPETERQQEMKFYSPAKCCLNQTLLTHVAL
jgi:hypothetical protein